MTCVRRGHDVQKNKMVAVLTLKIYNYITATRIPFLHSDNRKYFIWVFIRMCTIVTSSDMTSFAYIGDEKHHLSKCLERKRNDPPPPPAERNCANLIARFIEWLKKAKTNCKKMLDIPDNKKRFYCGTRLKTYNEVAGKQAHVQEVIESFCGLGSWIDRSRQLIGMATVNLGVVCKLIFAFPSENICVDLSVR